MEIKKDFDQFYVTLPSNASMGHFPQNTKANFVTELSSPLKFEYPYEVAIAEIITPSISNDQIKSFGKIEIWSLEHEDIHDTAIIEITSDDVRNVPIEQLLVNLNKKLAEASKKIKMAVAPEMTELLLWTNKIKQFLIQFNDYSEKYTVVFFGAIADILGFKKSNYEQNVLHRYSPRLWSDYKCDYNNFNKVNQFSDILFVYSDIIKHQFVGDSFSQLLRTVYVNKMKESQCLTYTSPHYVPLTTNTINSIKITIKDSENQLIKFASGNELVMIKLHFRPMKYGF